MSADNRVQNYPVQSPNAFAHVFVSYASQDSATANAVVESFEKDGVRCWFAPRDVTPGSLYADEIVAAINNTSVFVLLLSEHSIASSHVGRELERAASKRRKILVLRVDAAALTRPFEYFLSGSQWIDATALGVRAAVAKLSQAVTTQPPESSSSHVQKPANSSGDQKRGLRHGETRRWVTAMLALLIIAILGCALLYYPPWKRGASMVAGEKSIAVLPFADMSEKRDQEYFADGMAEEIIDLLVKIPGLKVVGRTSSFQFKGRSEDLREIGNKLGVRYILEGSVRQSGEHLRVTAQLIDSHSGTHVWSQTYDRNLSDVLKTQDEIAAALVRALQIEVSPAGISSRGTLPNTEAYTLYLKGLHALDRYDQQGYEQAVSYFEQAHDLDRSFEAAPAGLADTYFLLGMLRYMPLDDALDKARKSAELALQLDPNDASTHAVLGSIYGTYNFDWTAAEREYKIARALAPNDVHVLWVSSIFSEIMGRSDEALKFANACVDLAPLDPRCYGPLTQIQLNQGHLSEAEAAARRTLEISPTSAVAHAFIGDVLLARNQPEAALVEYTKKPWEAARLERSAMAYFAMGRRNESDVALAALEKLSNVSILVANVHAFRGETDEAFKWLDRGFDEKDTQLSQIKLDPAMKSLRKDARYTALLKKMNLPEG